MSSVPLSHFEALYARDPDPWHFETSDYEAEKYAATLAALDDRSFDSAAEIGCSIGVLTAMLAARCDSLVGVDFAEAALARARLRCAGLAHVRFERLHVPAEWPGGSFDLIVFSEVLYFLDASDVAGVAARVRSTLRPKGRVLLVNYLGTTDTPLSSEQAADAFIDACAAGPGPPGIKRVAEQRAASWRLDLLEAD